MRHTVFFLFMVTVCTSVSSLGQEANYDESKVPDFTLPDPLLLAGGQRVTDAATWSNQRRQEIVRLFENLVYGQDPGPPW